jgi:hypothetical protein
MYFILIFPALSARFPYFPSPNKKGIRKMEPLQTTTYKNHKISIYPDDNSESPRTWDNITEYHCCHRRYALGDKGFNYSSGQDCISAAQQAQKQGDIVLPLYLYDHSGITISLSPFSCPWDSGQVGFVIVRREKMLKEFSAKKFSKSLKAKALKIAQSEVETYDQYLQGDVYGYQVDEDGDSCWGYYGIEECLNEAKSVVDSLEIVRV